MVPRTATTLPRTPTAELSAVDALAQLSFLIQNLLARRAGEYGLSLIQTRLLGVLREREPTMFELATLLELDKSSVTGLVNRAQRRGHVKRSPSSTDRRVVLVTLTNEGRSLVSTVARCFEADVSQMLTLVPVKEAAAMTQLISRLVVAHAAGNGVDLFAGGTSLTSRGGKQSRTVL